LPQRSALTCCSVLVENRAEGLSGWLLYQQALDRRVVDVVRVDLVGQLLRGLISLVGVALTAEQAEDLIFVEVMTMIPSGGESAAVVRSLRLRTTATARSAAVSA
jgi:hypothetical protein